MGVHQPHSLREPEEKGRPPLHYSRTQQQPLGHKMTAITLDSEKVQTANRFLSHFPVGLEDNVGIKLLSHTKQ